MNFKKLSIKSKLSVMFLLIGAIPTIIVTLVMVINGRAELEQKAFDQLQSTNTIKAEEIESYFADRRHDLKILAETTSAFAFDAIAKLSAVQAIKKDELVSYFNQTKNSLIELSDDPFMADALKSINAAFKADGVNSTQWYQQVSRYQQRIAQVTLLEGWQDLYFINSHGDVVYSNGQKSDLGLNVNDKDIRDTSLAKAFNQAQSLKHDEITFADFSVYPHANNEPAAFFMTPIMNKKEQVQGFIAMQLPIDAINQIVLERAGMGKTGESYLVGPDHLMRSDSYLNPEKRSVSASFKLQNKISTKAVIQALLGNKHVDLIQGDNGNQVLSAWDYIEVIPNYKWAVISEVDISEALNPMTQAGVPFYQKYVSEYEYYDLFLIAPDGEVFYTVTNERDRNTNIINGQYANSNLGQLVRRVKRTQAPGFVDFAPYEPSNDLPSSFAAYPLYNKDKKLELIIAVQLSHHRIGDIMAERTGMGETGESYLVGEDKRMRSNSYLQPQSRNVVTSFSGSIALNGADTLAVERALTGETGIDVIENYDGNKVLSSYQYVDIDDFRWAVISEMDESEALAAIDLLVIESIILIVIIGLVNLVIARVIANKLSVPLLNVVDVANSVANADLSVDIKVTEQDEVGDIQKALKVMVENLRAMIGKITEVSIGQAATSEELAAVTTQTSASVVEQQQQTELVATAIHQMGATVKDISENTALASENAAKTHAKTMESTGHIDKTFESVIEVGEQTKVTSKKIAELREDTNQINSVLEVIKSIAEKTNLLALNAAIEAARAGEQGRGFAVVADEVRNLAQSTQDSTKEIESLIDTLVKSADQAVDTMNENMVKTEQLQQLAQHASTTNREVADEINQITDMVIEIATATEQQNTVINEIQHSIETINAGASETEQAAQHIAQSSNELSDMANQLEMQTSQFKVLSADLTT